MRRSALALAILSLSATAALGADGTFDKTLTVAGAATISVFTGSGYIHVSPGAGTQIHIVGHVHAHPGWLSADADARVKQILADPPIKQSGNTVTVGAEHVDSALFQNNISIDYDVSVPAGATLKAQTGSGELRIGGVSGTVTAGSGSGNVTVDDIGANARLETGSGSIHASNVHGAATVETGSGTIDLELSAPGDVKAQTGSGSIRISGIAGGLRAGAGSGSIQIAGTPTSDWRLESGSGGIHVDLAGTAKFNLNAETGSGSVHVDQPITMQGTLNQHHISGAVNGGGPTLRASTGSGDIFIR